MKWVRSRLTPRLRSRSGQGLVEYAFILVLVVIIIIVTALSHIGADTSKPMGEVSNVLSQSS